MSLEIIIKGSVESYQIICPTYRIEDKLPYNEEVK